MIAKTRAEDANPLLGSIMLDLIHAGLVESLVEINDAGTRVRRNGRLVGFCSEFAALASNSRVNESDIAARRARAALFFGLDLAEAVEGGHEQVTGEQYRE